MFLSHLYRRQEPHHRERSGSTRGSLTAVSLRPQRAKHERQEVGEEQTEAPRVERPVKGSGHLDALPEVRLPALSVAKERTRK